MMDFVPMKAEHILTMGQLVSVQQEMTAEVAVTLEEMGGVSAIDNGRALAIAGIMPKWEGVGMAWAWMSRDWLRHAREITDEVIRGLEVSEYPRIEMAVRAEFDRGHRWAKRLGFEMENPCVKRWGPDGKDYALYARLK